VKASRAEIREALRGRVTPHHRFLLREHLAMVDHLRERIAVFDAQIGAVLEPFRAAADRLVSIPGVSDVTAQVIVAEIGIDMTRFPTVRHLISWAGLKGRRGAMKAIVAVAASIPTAAYYMLRDGVTYREPGPDYFDRRDRTKLAHRLARRIKDLGFEVQLNAAA
jgi:transposase